ncbi:hypothetical protein ACFL02_01080 [Planctomycetota bacterium]
MMYLFKNHWPLITILLILWILVAALAAISVQKNDGHFVYALDDYYIHMAISKNLALHGNWGITRYAFSSSSSSLMWTFLLSGIFVVFGVNIFAALVLNIIFATLFCFLAYVILFREGIKHRQSLAVLLCLVFLTPLISLIFCGLEHVLQLLLTVIFVFLSAQILAKNKSSFSTSVLLLMAAPLLTMTRYEGLFLILVVCCLFLIRKRPFFALTLGFLALLPIVLYGLISLDQGGFFLPNSVLLKGNTPHLSSVTGIVEFLGYQGFRALTENPHVLFLLLAMLFMLILLDKCHFWSRIPLLNIILVPAILLHMQFADTGWFYRYEAYLIGAGILAIAVALPYALPDNFSFKSMNRRAFHKYLALLLLIILMMIPLVKRGGFALVNTLGATNNIYDQQYQMGLFLKKFYTGRAVAANDIGAINALADIRCLDLAGLGSQEVAHARKQGTFNLQKIDQLTRDNQVEIALLYDQWFSRRILSRWTKVGSWTISHNVVCAEDTVSFYAVDPAAADQLRKNLTVFLPLLPPDVAAEIIK